MDRSWALRVAGTVAASNIKAYEIGKEQVKDESERQAELRQLPHKIVTENPGDV
jgi:hypothetical protein